MRGSLPLPPSTPPPMPLAVLLLLAGHLALAALAFGVGVAALRRRATPAAHRRLGLAYVACWVALFASGAVLGARRPGVSVFEVINAVGMAQVALGFLIPAVRPVRRALGGDWMRWHVRLMLGSLAYPVVAALNQAAPHALGALGLPYPAWAFYLLVLSPFAVLPRVGRRMLDAYPADVRAEAAGRRGRGLPNGTTAPAVS